MTDLLQQTLEGLRKTKKGQLNYDSYWFKDENTREFLEMLDQSHRCLHIVPLPQSPPQPEQKAPAAPSPKKVPSEDSKGEVPDFHFHRQFAEKEMEILRCKNEAKKVAQREFYKKVEEFDRFSLEQKQQYDLQIEAIHQKKLERLQKLFEDFKVDQNVPKPDSGAGQEETVSKNVYERLKELVEKHKQEKGEREQRKLQEAQHLQAMSTLRDIHKVISDTMQLFTQCHQRGFEVRQDLDHLHALKGSVLKAEAECKQASANFAILIPKLSFLLEQVEQLQQRVAKQLDTRMKALQQHHQQQQAERKPQVDPQAQAQRTQIQEEPKPQPPATPEKSTAQPISSRKECLPNSFAEYQRLQNLKKEFEKQFAGLMEPAHKKFKFELHKATCQAVNSISDRVVGYCICRLRALLTGNKIDTWTGVSISVKDHPSAVYLCKYLIAKTIVSQGEEQVTGQPQTAVPIAKVLIELWHQFPDLGDLTRAFFYKRCPHLVPYFPWPRAGQSDEDYLKSVGYHVTTKGLPEKEDAFLKRMGGLATLYATILSTEPLHQREHPFGLQHLWQWLQETLSLEPLPDITATVLIHVLEVAAAPLRQTYQHQFGKLLQCLSQDYFPRIRAAASPECGGAPVKRLEDLLEKLLRQADPARRFQ